MKEKRGVEINSGYNNNLRKIALEELFRIVLESHLTINHTLSDIQPGVTTTPGMYIRNGYNTYIETEFGPLPRHETTTSEPTPTPIATPSSTPELIDMSSTPSPLRPTPTATPTKFELRLDIDLFPTYRAIDLGTFPIYTRNDSKPKKPDISPRLGGKQRNGLTGREPVLSQNH